MENRKHYSFSAQNIVDSHQARTMQLSEYYHKNTCEQSLHTRCVHNTTTHRLSTQSAITNLRSANLLFILIFLCWYTHIYITKENKSFLFCAYNVFLIYAVFPMAARMGEQIKIFNIIHKQGIFSLNQFTALPLYICEHTDTISVNAINNLIPYSSIIQCHAISLLWSINFQ